MGGRLSFLPSPVLGGNKTRQSFARQVPARVSRGGLTPAVSFLFKGTGKEENPIPALFMGEENVYELPPAFQERHGKRQQGGGHRSEDGDVVEQLVANNGS